MSRDHLQITGSLLIVDDEPLARQAVGAAFVQWGCDVVCVGSGSEAMEVLARKPIDVVLLDLRMPGMDGLTFLRKVQPQTLNTAYIILTAYASTETVIAALRCGVVDFLQKPVPFVEIGRVVETTLLRQQEVRRQKQAVALLKQAVTALSAVESSALLFDANELKTTAVIQINEKQQTAVYHDMPLELTPVEYRLMKVFAQHPDTIFSYSELAVYSHKMMLNEEEAKPLLRTHIYRLSRKLGSRETTPLQSVRGRGVIFCTEENPVRSVEMVANGLK